MEDFNIISISKFKATCLQLLQTVCDTQQELLITKNNKPVALIIPPPVFQEEKGSFGVMAKDIQILEDITLPVGIENWEVLKD